MGVTGRRAIAGGALLLSLGLLAAALLFGRGPETAPPDPAEPPTAVAEPGPLPAEPGSPPAVMPMPDIAPPQGVPSLAGVVLDHSNQPVARAEVTAYVADLGAERIRSGADGTFAFYGLAEARYRVSAVADGFNEGVVESAPFGSMSLTLVLEPLSAAAGYVLDAETREPISEFDVAYLDAAPDGEAHWQRLVASNRPAWRAAMDPSGAFRLDDLASGAPFAVAARAKGRQPAYIAVDALVPGELAADLVIYLRAAARVEGTVTNGRGEPLAGARILLGADPAGDTVLATTGADGAYTVEGLIGESVAFTAIHPKARPGTELTALLAGRTARVDFILDAGAGAEGYVTRGGEPLAGAMVYHFASERRGVGVGSGADGYYRLEGLPEGEVLIAASMTTEPGPSLMESRTLAAGTLERIDFDFPLASSSIEGYVTRDGAPAAEVMVRAVLDDAAAATPFTANAVTDEAGYFLIDALRAGAYAVVARQEGSGHRAAVAVGEGERVRQDFALGGGAGLSGAVSGLAEGEVAEIALLPPDTVIEHPEAFGSAEWLAIMSESVSESSAAGGVYRFEGVEPGAYLAVAIAFEPEGSPGTSVTDTVRIAQRLIEIGEGEQLTVDFDLGR